MNTNEIDTDFVKNLNNCEVEKYLNQELTESGSWWEAIVRIFGKSPRS